MSRIFDAMQRSEDIGPSHVLSVRERSVTAPAAEPQQRHVAVVAPGPDLTWGAELSISPEPENRLVSITDPTGLGAEQFRLLGVRLSNLQAQKNFKRVLIASTISGEGKTLVAANLAITLSRSQRKRVLLVEGDLRRPALSKALGLPTVEGLTHMISGNEPGSKFIHGIADMPLWYLAAGMPTDDPAAVLHSERLSQLLDSLSDCFDYVIVDSAPILPLADANLWLRRVDGMLLVVRHGKTPKTALAQALPMLDKPVLLGVVFNGAEHVIPHYGHYYKSYTAKRPSPAGERE